MKRLFSVLALSVLACQVFADNNSTDPPTYGVNMITADLVTTIDGIVSDGEWDAASDAAGDWVELTNGAADAHNLRFRMLWDASNLYILGETDFAGFRPPGDNFGDPKTNGTTYSPHLFFDPNLDEENFNERTDETNDGYAVSWSMDEGHTSRVPTTEGQALRDALGDGGLFLNDYIPGFKLEANVNSSSGNTGMWSLPDDGPNANYRDDAHPGIVLVQNADNNSVNETGQAGGVFEMSIAWAELDATNPNRRLTQADIDAAEGNGSPDLGNVGVSDPRFADPESEFFLENGLFAITGPSADDIWAFEIGAITPDTNNSTPSWSEPMGGNQERTSLESWGNGFGRLTFNGLFFDPLDCNADGSLDAGDITCVTSDTLDATLKALNVLPADFDADGTVGFLDFLTLAGNFGLPDVGYAGGDANLNGSVDFFDFLALAGNFGLPRPNAEIGDVAGVPEPSSLCLMAIAALGVVLRWRRC